MDNLKTSLYSHLHSSGVMNNLKAQMRTQLLQNLHPSVVPSSSPSPSSLSKRLSASLIADFLQKNDLQYSLSVFSPELNLELLQAPEIISLLPPSSLPPLSSSYYSAPSSSHPHPPSLSSLLERLVEGVIGGGEGGRKEGREGKREGWSQTEGIDGIMNLERKLGMVDEEWREKRKEGKENEKTMEERLRDARREIEKRLKAEMQAEVLLIFSYFKLSFFSLPNFHPLLPTLISLLPPPFLPPSLPSSLSTIFHSLPIFFRWFVSKSLRIQRSE